MSNFASAYKLKSSRETVAKKLGRRSVDWKSNREEEVNRRRNLKNFSPLQEISVLSNTNNGNDEPSYIDKTPVKPKTKRDKKEVKKDTMREKLLEWRKKKEAEKKKQNQEKKKPTFKVCHISEKDDPLLKKRLEYSKKLQEKTQTSSTVRTTTKNTEPTKHFVPVQKKESSKPVSHPIQSKKPVAVGSQKPASAERSSRDVKSSKVKKSQKSKSKEPKEVISKVSPKAPPKETSVATSSSSKANVENVTIRGLSSFAPEDFTFSAPSNITTFEFRPLSPNSCANFLYPNANDSTDQSFLGTEPKRCSTPFSTRPAFSNAKPIEETIQQIGSEAMNKDTSDQKPCSAMKREKVEDKLTGSSEVQKETKKNDLPDIEKRKENEGCSLRRSSRRSVAKNRTQDNTHSDTENVFECSVRLEKVVLKDVPKKSRKTDTKLEACQEISVCELPEQPTEITKTEIATPSKRLTRRSVAVAKEMGLEVNFEVLNIENTPKRKGRKSLAVKETEVEGMDTEEIHNTAEQSSGQAVSSPQISQSPEDSDSKPLTPVIPVIEESKDDKEHPKKENVQGKKKTRRTMSAIDKFQIPDSSSRVLSTTKSKKKRRKTMHDSAPKSPEEWISVLTKSPMIEMNRRTPRARPPSDEPPLPVLDLDFDIDMAVFDNSEKLNETGSQFSQETEQRMSEEEHIDEKESNPDASIKHESPNKAVNLHVAHVADSENGCDKEEAMDTQDEEHDVKYFRKLLISQTNRLNKCVEHWNSIMAAAQSSLSEDVQGQIRSVIGQVHLLINQRFKQFEGLVDNCEFCTGEKEIKCSDLQGFWDMIYFQVEDVDAKLDDLKKLQERNWEPEKTKIKKITKKNPSTKPKVTKPVGKSKFAAFRDQMKKEPNVPVKKFDGNFFEIESPIKTPKYHCEAGSPKPKQQESEQGKGSSLSEVSAPKRKTTPLQELSVVDLTPHRTPMRKSYVPVNPSPLLQDTTPRPARKRRSSAGCTPCPKKARSEVEKECDDQVPKKVSELESVEVAKKTTPAKPVQRRRSHRIRKSVTFCEPDEAEKSDEANSGIEEKNESDDWFLQYLKPSKTRVSLAPAESVLDNIDTDEKLDSNVKSTPGTKRRRRSSTLKELPSSSKRRSIRKSSTEKDDVFALASTVNSQTNDCSPVIEEDVLSGNFLKGTPSLRRKTRSSLLFSPLVQSNGSSEQVPSQDNEVPTGVLISFTP